VTEAGKALNRDFGGDIAAAYERAIAAISASRNFWGRFADIPEQEFDTAATVTNHPAGNHYTNRPSCSGDRHVP
jgi:hypothetical protein